VRSTPFSVVGVARVNTVHTSAGVKIKISETEVGVREAETQKSRTDAKNAKLKLFLEASREEQGPNADACPLIRSVS
jgi:hypothetical protein